MHTKRKDDDGELLAGVATDLLRFNDPERLLSSIFDRISNYTKVDLCFSYFVREQGLESVFLGGLPLHLHSQVNWLNFGETVCGTAAQSRSSARYESISKSDAPAVQFLKQVGVEAFCCYPLLTGGKLLGILSFGSRTKERFEPDEVEIQQAIADQVAVAFDRISLLQELGQSNQKLLAINADLKRAHAELEQIAFSVSHDLREPVRHLSIYTELLQRQLESDLPEPATRYLQFVLSSAKRVELLVSDLLQYTGLSLEAPESQVLDTRAITERVCLKLQPLIAETGTTVAIAELPPTIMAEDDLSVLMENLIENAIVHHRVGVPPAIQIFSCAAASGTAICVRDNGIGIDPQHQSSIFGMFKRLHMNTAEARSGIGLTLCRKIVERYEGEIWVESQPGQGALFCFTCNQHAQLKSRAARSGLSA